MFYEVIPTKIFRQDAATLTYSSEAKLLPGQIVIIPLGKKEIPGIVLKKTLKPAFQTKKISKILYQTPLPAHLLEAAKWLSSFYLTPLPGCANLILPTGITKKRRQTPVETTTKPSLKTPQIPLNTAQKKALSEINNCSENTKLLHGITGSGKTNIYLQLAASTLKLNQSVILLVPEIALTPQLIEVFEKTFPGRTCLIHSRQTEATRHHVWEQLLDSTEPKIIIGPRSAIFAPVKNLGLIIIDEAHDQSYYQENPPKYSTLRLASFIAKTNNISCILGTATPNVTDYFLAKTKNSLISLSLKAIPVDKKPETLVVDLKNRQNFVKNRYFSDPLIKSIEENLAHHEQTLIFHNRRGSAPLTICTKCGWQALCPQCFLPLTLHADQYILFCHTCGYQTKVPSNCPECHHPDIIHKGFGTKLLENELKKLFKSAKIARFDGDNHKSETLDTLYDEIKTGKFDIIIGTQTIAKGLDLPKLATVGIVQADSGLSLPDYSSEERTFNLLNQVIGRVGRGHIQKAHIVVQTYQPNHPAITTAISNDYQNFYNYEIAKLKKQKFPPFTHLAKITATAKTELTTIRRIKSIRNILLKNPKISVSLPTPAFHERTTSGYTWQIILKSSSRAELQKTLAKIDPKSAPHITLDPPSLL